MAVRFDASGDQLVTPTSASSLPTTIMAWVRVTNAQSGYAGIAVYFNGSTLGLYLKTSSNTLNLYNGGDNLGSNLTTGTWYHVALTAASGSGVSRKAFLNAVQDISVTGNSPGVQNVYFGNSNAGERLDGRMAGIKQWSAELSATEIAMEMNAYMPIRKADLMGVWPLINHTDAIYDFSGSAVELTPGGTLTTEDGPGILWGREDYQPSPMALAVGGGGGGGARSQAIIIL